MDEAPAPLTLHQKQVLFSRLNGLLRAWAFVNGYEITDGESYRTPQQAQWDADHGTGIARSEHTLRLAQDFNVFKDGVYLTRSEDLSPLGVYWKSLDPLCRWGGDFTTRPDGNHFSLYHEGVS